MAELSIENLKELAATLGGDVGKSLTSLVSTLLAAGEGFVNLETVSDKLGASFKNNGEGLKSFNTAVADIVLKGAFNFKILEEQARSIDPAISGAAVKILSAVEPIFFNVLPKGTEAFGALGDKGEFAGAQISASFSKVAPIINGILSKIPIIGDKLVTGIPAFIQTADSANNLERNIIGLLGASGQLNDIVSKQTGSFKSLDTVAGTFINTMSDIAQATGNTLDETMNFAAGLSIIPDTARGASISIAGLDSDLNDVQTALTIAAGSGIKNADATKILTDAYLDLNVTGQKSYELLANIGGVSRDLVLPLDNVRDFTMKVASSFKFMGDNSQAALNVLAAFGPALQDSGLGPNAIQELVSGMTDGIKGMDIAHKAFISGASGGRKGIAGAFEMDMLLRQGKMDEVMKRTMGAMKQQFGGPVVTLEDANRDPNKSGDLLKQMSFLKDVAGLAKNDDQAYRILEAMQKGSVEDLQRVTDEQKTSTDQRMKESVDRGVYLQERGNTYLNKIAVEAQRIAMIQGQVNAKTLREKLGTESETFDIRGNMKESGAKAQGRSFFGQGDTKETPIEKFWVAELEGAKEKSATAADLIVDAFKEMPVFKKAIEVAETFVTKPEGEPKPGSAGTAVPNPALLGKPAEPGQSRSSLPGQSSEMAGGFEREGKSESGRLPAFAPLTGDLKVDIMFHQDDGTVTVKKTNVAVRSNNGSD